MSIHKERKRKAQEVIAQYNMCYMEGSGEDPLDGVDQFLIITQTDGGTDLWIDYRPNFQSVEGFLSELIRSEWGVVIIHDLDTGNLWRPLEVVMSTRIDLDKDLPQGKMTR